MGKFVGSNEGMVVGRWVVDGRKLGNRVGVTVGNKGAGASVGASVGFGDTGAAVAGALVDGGGSIGAGGIGAAGASVVLNKLGGVVGDAMPFALLGADVCV